MAANINPTERHCVYASAFVPASATIRVDGVDMVWCFLIFADTFHHHNLAICGILKSMKNETWLNMVPVVLSMVCNTNNIEVLEPATINSLRTKLDALCTRR